MNMGMSMTHVTLNIVMAVVGGIGGFFLGRLTARVAREANDSTTSTSTGAIRVTRAKKFRKGQWIGGAVVAAVLLLLLSGALTQSSYDTRLKCNSDYINQFQETLRQNTQRTAAANNANLAYIEAQREFLDGVGSDPDPEALRKYVSALNTYQGTLVRARDERQPYPANPQCEEQ